MIRLLIAVLLSLSMALPAQAGSYGRSFRGVFGGLNITAACPYGTSFADGCAGAITTASFKVSTSYGIAFNTYSTSQTYVGAGQTWNGVHMQPWNVAGVDYPVGYDTTLSLKDPSTTPPANCAYSATGGLGNGPRVVCNTANPVDVEGYDFSLHNGISLVVLAAGTSVTVKNNKFSCGSAICNGASGGLINIGGTVSVYIGNNLFEGGDEPTSTICGGGRCTSDQVSGISINNSSGNRTVEYNAFLYFTGRPIAASAIGNVTSIRRFNYVEGLQGQDAQSQHGEFIIETNPSVTSVAEEDDLYNTIVNTKYNPANQGSALLYLSTGAGTSTNNGNLPVTFALWNVIGNTLIGNYNGANLAPNGGAYQQAFNGTVSGTTLTVNSGATSVPIGAAVQYSGGSTNPYPLVASGTFPTYTLSYAPGNATGVTVTSNIYTQGGLITVDSNAFTKVVAQSNYLDATGVLQNACFRSNQAGLVTTADFGAGGKPNVGGTQNVSMTSGLALSPTWSTSPTSCL